jgi:hypothetical protein
MMTPLDTVFVALPTTPASHDWAVQLLAGLAIALASWALSRTVEHGNRIQKVETFTGSEDGEGLSAKIDKIEASVERIAVNTQTVAISVARIEGRGDSHPHA